MDLPMLRPLTSIPTGPCPAGEGFWGLQEGGLENTSLLHILYAGRGTEGFMEEVTWGQQEPSLNSPHTPCTPLGAYFGPGTWPDCLVL